MTQDELAEPQTKAGKRYANGSLGDMIRAYGSGWSLRTVIVDIETQAAALVRTPETLDVKQLRREIERLRVRELIGSVAAERLLAAARGEPPEDAVDLAALLHDNGFSWDDANAVNAILTHHELVVLRAATPSPTPPEGRVGGARKLYDEASFDVDGAPFPPSPTPPEGLRRANGAEVLDLDRDDFRDDHERAIRAHILEGPEDHRCDDLCSAAIIDRLVGKHPTNEYPRGSDLAWERENLAAASPAPDPGAGLREAAAAFLIAADNASLEALVDAEDGAEVPDWQERLWDAVDVFRAALSPSAEPPETAGDGR